MKAITIAALLLSLLAASAAAETIWTPNGLINRGMCSNDGRHWFPARDNGLCYASDAPAPWVLPTTDVAPPGRCEGNRLLVMMMDGSFMCAADLTMPKR